MLMPQLRHSIKTDAVKNRGLKDILSPTAKAIEVISVEELEYDVYNTKTVAIIEENGIQEERVLIYNRVDLRPTLGNYMGDEGGIARVIELMNIDGHDVTTDDVYLDGLQVKVKETSLGYYEGEVDAGSCALRHYFKVTLLGADKNQSCDDVRDALNNSFINLTAPTQPQLHFVQGYQHISADGIYQYTIVNVGMLDYARGGGEDMSVQFTLPRIGDTSDEWSEILPTGPIIGLNTEFTTLTTFAPDDSHTIVRCIVTEHSAA
jgi:hypothetical protein